jgi:hypothetical protein
MGVLGLAVVLAAVLTGGSQYLDFGASSKGPVVGTYEWLVRLPSVHTYGSSKPQGAGMLPPA